MKSELRRLCERVALASEMLVKPKTSKSLTQEELNEIMTEREQGSSWAEIEQEHGLARHSASRAYSKFVDKPSCQPRFKGLTDFLAGIERSEEVRNRCQRFAELYYVSGWSMEKMERAYDIGTNARGNTAKWILKYLNKMADSGALEPTWRAMSSVALIGADEKRRRIIARRAGR